MRYTGSKGRIAKDILPIILQDRKPDQWYVEPFCGGCNMLDKVTGKRVGNDLHVELIAYFKAVQNGWSPPERIYEEDYERIRKESKDPVLRAYVGFSFSFGGKYFGSIARHKAGIVGGYQSLEIENRNALRQLERQRKDLKGVVFYCGRYDCFSIPSKSLIYCDPPYRGTTGYKETKLNHNQFYDWCRFKKAQGHTIFISEYSMPKDFKEVWSKKVNMVMNQFKGTTPTVEKLFTL